MRIFWLPKSKIIYKNSFWSHNFIFRIVEQKLYQTDREFVEKINGKQSSWTATHYDFLNQMKISDLIKMAGGKKSRILKYLSKFIFKKNS